MNKAKLLVIAILASMAITFAACDKEDNPIKPEQVTVDDPQEQVTDQPAYSRTK